MYETKPYFYGTGRRKDSVARVRVYQGTGKVTINDRDIDNYFGLETLKLIVRSPLVLLGLEGKYDVVVRVSGGGVSGQAGAIRHGLSRALLQQGAAQAVADSASLAGNTAAGNADDDVILALEAQQDQRRADDQLQGLQTEVVVDVTVVDGDLASALVDAHAGNGILTTTSAVEIRFGFVHVRLPPS